MENVKLNTKYKLQLSKMISSLKKFRKYAPKENESISDYYDRIYDTLITLFNMKQLCNFCDNVCSEDRKNGCCLYNCPNLSSNGCTTKNIYCAEWVCNKLYCQNEKFFLKNQVLRQYLASLFYYLPSTSRTPWTLSKEQILAELKLKHPTETIQEIFDLKILEIEKEIEDLRKGERKYYRL